MKAEPQHAQRSAPDAQQVHAQMQDGLRAKPASAEHAFESPRTAQLLAMQAMIDASPRTAQLRRLAEMVAQSPRALQFKAQIEALDNSPRVVAQREQMAALFGHAPVQRVQEEEPTQGRFIAQRVEMEEEEPIQGKLASPMQGIEEEALKQGKSQGSATTQLESAPAPNRTGMPDTLKAGVESLSGMSLDHVKVHYNSDKPAQLSALAYAQGSEIHVAPGQEQHLPHEAWHVVQQAQGRVQPTVQMAGVAVNDDGGLEHEADVMGESAARYVREEPVRPVGGPEKRLCFSYTQADMHHSPQIAAGTALQAALNNSPSAQAMRAVQRMVNAGAQKPLQQPAEGTIQRKIQPVNEEVIKHEKERNPDLDEDYFDGLYYGNGLATYVYAGTVAENLVKRGGLPDKKIHLYVLAEQTTEGAIDTLLQSPDPSMLSFVSENEEIRVTGKEIIAAANELNVDGGAIFQKLLVGAMDAEPKGGAGGEFGNIEFRFKKTKGYLCTSVRPEVVSDEKCLVLWKDELKIIRMTEERLQHYVAIYRALNLPYPEERIGTDYLFVSEDYVAELRAYNTPEEAAEFEDGGHFDVLKETNDENAPIPGPPGPKVKEKKYVRKAIRGDRGKGQKAAMSDISAKEYADFFTGNQAGNIDDWEWLHLQGSRLGGKNESSNLVAGTASANSNMIPLEREILALSRDSDDEHPVEVKWTATLKEVGGELTHIGDKIQIVVRADRGTKSNATARAFSKDFDATEGETFTKFDRDSARAHALKNGGRRE